MTSCCQPRQDNDQASLPSGKNGGWASLLDKHNRSPLARTARVMLAGLEPGYRLIVQSRNRLFDRGWRSATTLPHPTISIGNLTAGGTGKTPLTIALARKLQAWGHHPAVLLRGYRAAAGRSDEAVELASELGSQVPVQADPDRAAAARRAMQSSLPIDVFLLDDGFQHRRINRDLDLVLIDATRPWGHDHLLPRGLLREPKQNLRRAAAVIVTRADQIDSARLAELDREIESLTGRPVLAHLASRWTGYRSADNQVLPLDLLRHQRVVGFAGLGNPAGFIASLEAHAKEVVKVWSFPDHHPYTQNELRQMFAKAARLGAQAIVTTEKDWSRLPPPEAPPEVACSGATQHAEGCCVPLPPPEMNSRIVQPPALPGGTADLGATQQFRGAKGCCVPPSSSPLPLYRAVLSLHWLDGQDDLDTLLRSCLEKAQRGIRT
ncbi:MAG: tetraacyldisaccharide 4'-kinase [Phycisphaeraceae bacterium]|nr:tetraacyldisaccharide 4'-kinase [Phycisphaeraceae bacterium]